MSAPQRFWDLQPYLQALAEGDFSLQGGRVAQMVGLLVESDGPPAAIGDFCEIRTRQGRPIRVQVVGFRFA